MKRLPELLDDAVGPIEPGFEIDDLTRHVKRRRRTRLRLRLAAVAVVVLAGVGTTLALVAGRTTSQQVRVRPSATTSSDVLVFDDNGGIITLNAQTHIATHHPLPGWRGGDPPFLSWRVHNTFVVGWGDVHATSIAGDDPHLLGAGVFVPATEPGAVWLTSYGKVQTRTDRLVDMHGRVLLAGATPAGTPITGIPGGLVLQTSTGLDIWDARTGRIIRHLGTAPGFAAPASGSVLAWCDHCNRSVQLTDLGNGTTRSIAVRLNGASLDMNRPVFSPDGTRLAVPAVPDSAAPISVTAHIVLINVATGQVVNQIDTRARNASIAWSPDSRRIYFAATDNYRHGQVLAYDTSTNATQSLGPVPDSATSLSSALAQDGPVPASSTPTLPSPSGPVIIADCAIGFHNPPHRTDICVKNA
jgi:hypothetical protein